MTTASATNYLSSITLDVTFSGAATFGVSSLFTTIDPVGATLFVTTQRIVHLASKYILGDSTGNNASKFLYEFIPLAVACGTSYYVTRAAGYNFTAKAIGASLLTAQPYILVIGIIASYAVFSYSNEYITRGMSVLSNTNF